MTASKLGIAGGTFDPIHLGHLAVAAAARDCAGLDRVILVPAAIPPHRGPAAATPEDRLVMARLAAGGGGFEVSDLEVAREGPSYTLDTLLALTAANPRSELHLVLGWDAAREIGAWHRPRDVLALARLVIVARAGAGLPVPGALRAAGIDPARATLCPGPTPDVSATEIRARVAAGRSIAGLVPDAVARYISERGLYRVPPRA